MSKYGAFSGPNTIKYGQLGFVNRQLGFVTLNGNMVVNLKPTLPPLLNGKGQITFLKTKSSHSSGTVMYPPKFEFLKY